VGRGGNTPETPKQLEKSTPHQKRRRSFNPWGEAARRGRGAFETFISRKMVQKIGGSNKLRKEGPQGKKKSFEVSKCLSGKG